MRYASSSDGGKTWSANQTLKAQSCECCWNALATGPAGHVAALYRGRSPRDMAVALSPDAGQSWNPEVTVGGFGWKFDGCPHVGGGLAFGPSALHAVIWTGLSTQAGVHHAVSSDAGSTWSQPQRLGSPAATRPDIAANGQGSVAVVMEDNVDGKSGIRAIRSASGGLAWDKAVTLSAAGSRPSHPRVVASGTGFRVFWTETPEGKPTTWNSALLQ